MNTKKPKWWILKLLLTISLFGLSWVYRPAQASDCPGGATLNAVCVTISDCGDQSCDALGGEPGGSNVGYCQKEYLGGECVHYGCAGGVCSPGPLAD
jgi:hypothetical protein